MENSWIKRNKWIFVAGPLALARYRALRRSDDAVVELAGAHALRMASHHFWQAMGLLVSAGSSSEA